MNEQKIHFVTLEMSSLDEYSQRELNAYRNIGTIRELQRLKHQEMHRRERRWRLHRLLDLVLGGVIFAGIIVACIFLCVLLT